MGQRKSDRLFLNSLISLIKLYGAKVAQSKRIKHGDVSEDLMVFDLKNGSVIEFSFIPKEKGETIL